AGVRRWHARVRPGASASEAVVRFHARSADRRGVAVRSILIAVALCAFGAANAQDLLIRGATVHTASARGTLENADVLVRGERIVAVSSGIVAPDGVTIVEARGRPLTPGFYAGLTSIGISEVWGVSETVNTSLSFGTPAWQQQWRPEFDVTRAFNSESVVIPVTRIEGLT